MDSGDEEPRSTSVSSLASRFEQLASSTSSSVTSSSASVSNHKHHVVPSSKNSISSVLTASAPPSSGPPPVKRPKPITSRSFPLQEQAARLEAADEEKYRAVSETASPTEATFKSGVSSSRPALPPVPARPPVQQQQRHHQHKHEQPTAISPLNTRHLEETAERLAPPPIPHATRPSLTASSTPSFAYNLSPPQSTSDDSTRASLQQPAASPKRSRTPPPIPASRRSRPATPSAPSYVDVPISPTSSMAVELDKPMSSHTHHSVTSTVTSGVSSGVNAIAAKFGHAKPSKSYCTTPPSRKTSPESKLPAPHQGRPFDPHTASRALQNAMTEDTSSQASVSQPHSGHASPMRPASTIDATSNVARTATPPPVVPRHSRPMLKPPDNVDVTARSAPATTRASPLPPALPSRDRSNSLQRNAGSQTESSDSLAPPLPSRGIQEASGRPRAATAFEARSPKRPAEAGAPPRRETIPISSVDNDASYIPPPPPVRNIQNGEARSTPVAPADKTLGSHGHQFARNAGNGTMDSSSSSSEDDQAEDKKALSEMPDASFANRRPPNITPERRLYPKHSVSAFAVHGRYAISATTHLRIWDTWTGETTGVITLQGEHKVVAVEFVFTGAERGKDGRIAWAGTKDGNLFEVDIQAQCVIETKNSAHSSPISVIYRTSGNRVVTVCESGKVQIWSNDADPRAAPSLSSTPRTQRLGDKHCYLKCFGEQLWSCHGPLRQSTLSSHLSSNAVRSPTIRVYDVGGNGAANLTTRAMHTLDNGCPVGPVMAGAIIPCEPNLVYLAHETGHISKWDSTALECIDVVRVSPYAITALEGVNDMLWAGNREGSIYVYDTQHTPWKVAKAWKAADEPICGLQVDLATLGTSNMLHVASYGRENLVMWDGLLEVDWLEHSMLKREPEFSSYRDIKVFIFSWNIDSSKPADLQNDPSSVNCLSDALHSSLHGASQREEPPEVVVFGLQEVVDLENKKLTAKNMLLGRKKADAMFQDQVSHQYMRWHDRLVQAVRTSMPADSPYYLLHAENLVGLQTLIFAKNSEKPNISDVAKISVKTGMGGRYGNKGAILARLVIDDSSICFLNCHLAAGQRATRQRNKDLVNILENKAAFLHPSAALPGVYIGGNGQTVFEHEICFLSGDLNYRVSLTRSIVSANIRSSNLKLLLDHDQLAKEMKTNQAFRLRSFREADINFPPTYKFDPGTNNYDSSAKERIPAWCDRILYRVHEPSPNSEKIRPLEYRSWSATPSDHKPISGLYAVRIKKMDRELRQEIRDEMEVAWTARAKDILIDAKRFHGLV